MLSVWSNAKQSERVGSWSDTPTTRGLEVKTLEAETLPATDNNTLQNLAIKRKEEEWGEDIMNGRQNIQD
jgi:hypothetical protein